MSPVGRLHDAVTPQAIPSLLDDDVAHSDRDRDRRARASVEIRQETGGSLSRLDAGALRGRSGRNDLQPPISVPRPPRSAELSCGSVTAWARTSHYIRMPAPPQTQKTLRQRL